MKKVPNLLLTFIISQTIYAQNVGINNSSPKESLDVTGNINLTGTLKTNGIDGTANQVLIKNGAGTMVWGDLTDYKNFKVYFTGNSTYTVPAGVTKLAVEVWGAGGGGAASGGGGGGAYTMTIVNTSPGTIANIIIGQQGNGSYPLTTPTDGGLSSFIISGSIQIIAYGGGGATQNFPGNGGFVGVLNPQGLNYNGQSGRKNAISYFQVSPTIIALHTKYGTGGLAPFQTLSNADGGYSLEYISGGSGTAVDVGGGQAYSIGEGGGGGKTYGGAGSVGRIVVHW